jgi:hypothetical protein
MYGNSTSDLVVLGATSASVSVSVSVVDSVASGNGNGYSTLGGGVGAPTRAD